MTRKELIERIMNVAENYKNGDLYGTGALTDIGILVDEYTESVVKNSSMADVSKSVARCGSCKQELTLVRPGKYQCDNENCPSNHR